MTTRPSGITLKTSTQVLKELGITYRQLNHWIYRGWVDCEWVVKHGAVPAPMKGSGTDRRFTPEQVARLREIRDVFRQIDALLDAHGMFDSTSSGVTGHAARRAAS